MAGVGTNVDQTSTIDILVVGAGAAGLTAAIAAHEDGAKVAVIDKHHRCAGNTALSSGSIPGAGTRFQHQRAIHDSPSNFLADLGRIQMDTSTKERASTLAELSPHLVEWLVDVAGVELVLIDDYKHVGHSVPRLHAPASRRGVDLLHGLERAVITRDIVLGFRTKLVRLLTKNGRVTGACIEGPNGERSNVFATAAILATNGFGASTELLNQYIPNADRLISFGAPTSTGDGIVVGQTIGAAVENMGAFQGHGSVSAKLGALVTWTVVEHGGVIVDADGCRFGDEDLGYSAFAEVAAAHPGPHYLFFDDDTRRRVSCHQRDFAELMSLGAATTKGSLNELAATLNLPADRLARSTGSLATPPWHAIEIVPALFHTQGGLSVDHHARVLRNDRSVIEGLFAAGGTAAGISGSSGAAGYTSGNGLLSACGLGLLAGRFAARTTQQRSSKHQVTSDKIHV